VNITTAWQSALAAEHRAVFGYGLLGPRLTGAERTAARQAEDAHIDLRNAAAAALAAAGQTPVAPLADYPQLYPVNSAKAAIRLAITLEDAAAAAWRFFYAALADANGTGAQRAQAQTALTSCAVRATSWRLAAGAGSPTVPFPGIG
jgi:hypothetical protein